MHWVTQMNSNFFNSQVIDKINRQVTFMLSLLLIIGLNQSAMAAVSENAKATYVGRTQYDRPYYSQREVIKQSSGYDARYQYSNDDYRYPNNGRHYDNDSRNNDGRNNDGRSNRRYSKRPRVSANFYYQAPTTTTITRNVQIIPPQNGVGDVYYNQDSYYIYPPQPVSRPYYHRPYQSLTPITIDPKDTENRSKQWTDKDDFNR